MSISSTDLQTSMLFCRLCQSLFRQPRILPCLHSFCHDCLKQLATSKKDGETSLACPVCGKTTVLGSEGISGLTSNEFLARVCQEYVEEVQKTIVSNRPMSPSASQTTVSNRPMSPLGDMGRLETVVSTRSGISARGPASPITVGRTQDVTSTYTASGQGVSTSSPAYSVQQSTTLTTTSPGGSTQLHGSMSPRGQSVFDYSFHTRLGTTTTTSTTFTSPQGAQQPSQHPLLERALSPHRHSSSTSSSSSDLVHQTARRLSTENIARGIHRRLSSTPRDVLRTWECLQHKLNALQTAALQVTYSLDSVNMAESYWHQRKQDLKRDVQRRSAQLQFFIKRQERLLLAALDSRHTDEGFMEAADRARAELRDNLRSLMHETDVLRSVLDFGTDQEIMSLSGLLLGSTVSQTPVTMTTPELQLVLPDDVSIEDMVSKEFGCLTSTLVTQTVFTPEEVDVTSFGEDIQEDDAFVQESASNEDTTEPQTFTTTTTTTATDHTEDDHDDIAYIDDDEDSEEEEVVVEETFEIIDGKMQIVSKKSVVPSKKEKKSKHKEEKKSLSQETKDTSDTRGRGRERHVFGRAAASKTETISRTTDIHQGRTEDRASSGAVSSKEEPGKTGEVSAKAETSPVIPGSAPDTVSPAEKYQSIRESLRQRRKELLLSGTGLSRPLPGQVTDVIGQSRRVQSLDRTSVLREQPKRSQSPASPQRRVVPTVTVPVVQSVAQHSSATGARRFSADSATGEKEEEEPASPTSPTSPTEKTSRPVRRAISAASDRASKMEYLRETWRKRKELLIQNEAFIPAAPIYKVDELTDDGKDKTEDTTTSEDSETSPSKTPKVKPSLRTRFSNLKQAWRKNGKADASKTEEKPSEVTTEKETWKAGVSKPSEKMQQSVEDRVLQTVESILQKKGGAVPTSTTATTAPAVPPTSSISTSPQTSYSKPSMAVKPHPRAPSPDPSPVITSMLEPVQEGKVAESPTRKPGLRVTSPPNTDISKERIQQVRATMRKKKERWRSLSLT